MAYLLGIPKLQSTYILTPDCQPAFNPVLRLGAGQGERHRDAGVWPQISNLLLWPGCQYGDAHQAL